MRVTLHFEDDSEAAAFVNWYESEGGPSQLGVVVAELIESLTAKGWTRHGYVDDTWCPPDMVYIAHEGCYDRDDPHAIAGRWECSCGWYTDRLAHAQGHMQLADEGVSLMFPGPHAITEVERRGPEHREWGEK